MNDGELGILRIRPRLRVGMMRMRKLGSRIAAVTVSDIVYGGGVVLGGHEDRV